MSGEEARVVAQDGRRHTLPARFWTDRSVFLEGKAEFQIGEEVRIEHPTGLVRATVALVCDQPLGILVAFDRVGSVERWDDEGETGRYDTQSALSSLMDSEPDSPDAFASEEPTNPHITTRLRETTHISEPPADSDETDG